MTMWLWRCGSECERAITRSVYVIGVSDGFIRGGTTSLPLEGKVSAKLTDEVFEICLQSKALTESKDFSHD